MIQFNLLPDVKLEYIRLRRLKRLLISISSLTAVSLLVVALLLFAYVNLGQKKYMNDLDKDITVAAKKLRSIQDIDRVITVQNQLSSLTALHEEKPAASRLFGYLAKVTPTSVSIAEVNSNFADSTLTISGGAEDLLSVNKFIDTLKFTNYRTGEEGAADTKAFTSVLLTGFSASEPGESKGATYQISLNYDPIIYDNKQSITLNVPDTITTRSQLSQPNALFQKPITIKKGN